VISGAGPTVLAFDPGSGALPAAVEGFVTVPVEVDSGGALARVTGF
jgi:hypothetical protein